MDLARPVFELLFKVASPLSFVSKCPRSLCSLGQGRKEVRIAVRKEKLLGIVEKVFDVNGDLCILLLHWLPQPANQEALLYTLEKADVRPILR